MSKWLIRGLGKNIAEIVAPNVRYLAQADANSYTRRFLKGKASRLEKYRVKHVGHNYRFDGIDEAGRTEQTNHVCHLEASGFKGRKGPRAIQDRILRLRSRSSAAHETQAVEAQ